MAQSNPTSTLTESLFASLCDLPQETPRARRLREAFARRIKSHNYIRTNQFDVSTRLDGLQEKFTVLNNDELAQALRVRLNELQSISYRWTPDILDLLLHLSRRPLVNSRVEDLERLIREPEPVQNLTWADIQRDDPIDKKDEIWKSIRFTGYSSDEDELETPSSASGSVSDDVSDDVVVPVRPAEGSEALQASLQNAQFWLRKDTDSIVITEVQAIREAIFMLLGLPTSIFWRVGSSIEIDRRYQFSHVDHPTLRSAFSSLGSLGLQLDSVRSFLKDHQENRVLQTFQQAVGSCMKRFDSSLSDKESELLDRIGNSVASLMDLLVDVRRRSESVRAIVPILETMRERGHSPVVCLEALFDSVTLQEALCRSEVLQVHQEIFLESFATYMKPVWDWMRSGTVISEEPFFVRRTASDNKSRLWAEWYTLTVTEDAMDTPRFLRSHLRAIFSAGKSAAFLKLTDAKAESHIDFDASAMRTQLATTGPFLLPFEHRFSDMLESRIQPQQYMVSKSLYVFLDQSCGLRRALRALRKLYFGQLGSSSDSVAAKIFDRIDKCRNDWNDPYVLGQLLRTAFEDPDIDVLRIKVQSLPGYSRNLYYRRQSVNLLKGFAIVYSLPWSLANIISKASLVGYQRVSTFLLQIRRAIYVLERRSLKNLPLMDRGSYRKVYSARQHLLSFTKTLADHFTGYVIDAAFTSLSEMLERASDLDAMITAHNEFVMALQHRLLLTKALKPLRDAVIDVLDLCVRFSDVTSATPVSDSGSNADAQSFISARTRSRPRRLLDTGSSEDDEDDDDDLEGYSFFAVGEDRSHVEQLLDIRNRLDKQAAFLLAGLQGLARADEDSLTWEILAERLNLDA